jgi:hypothetical protein
MMKIPLPETKDEALFASRLAARAGESHGPRVRAQLHGALGRLRTIQRQVATMVEPDERQCREIVAAIDRAKAHVNRITLWMRHTRQTAPRRPAPVVFRRPANARRQRRTHVVRCASSAKPAADPDPESSSSAPSTGGAR